MADSFLLSAQQVERIYNYSGINGLMKIDVIKHDSQDLLQLWDLIFKRLSDSKLFMVSFVVDTSFINPQFHYRDQKAVEVEEYTDYRIVRDNKKQKTNTNDLTIDNNIVNEEVLNKTPNIDKNN